MILRQLASTLILPFNVIVTVPVLLYLWCGKGRGLALYPRFLLIPARVLASLLLMSGFTLLVLTIRDFINIGQGTLAPWDPTKKLVVYGLYRYVRNPMISGVISVLFGVALLLNSVCHGVWLVLFTVANVIYMPLSEEPGLEKRFGDDYRRYRQNVPRWLPRRDPWQ